MTAKQLEVLVVEDDPDLSEMLLLTLNKRGYGARRARRGSEAFEKLEGPSFDCILLDVMLPDTTGFEILDRVRGMGIEVPVIVMTGHASMESAVEALRRGADDYLKKPFDSHELLTRIEIAVEHRRIKQDISNRKKAESALRKSRDELEVRVAQRTAQLAEANRHLESEIAERKRAVKDLLQSKNLLQSVFDGIPDPLLLVGRDLSVKMMNRAASAYFTMDDQPKGNRQLCADPASGQCRVCGRCSVVEAVKRGEPAVIERQGLVDPERIEKVYVYPVPNDGGEGDSAILRISDITEARRLERDLIQADKMISLGVLVSGVAHEINNPNNFIMLNTPILLETWHSVAPVLEAHYRDNGDFSLGGLPYTEMRDEIPRLFAGIEEGSRRIKRIVQDLKDFSRRDASDMGQSVDVNKVAESAVTLVGNLIKKSTRRFRAEYGQNLPSIKGNRQKLEQVVINLLQNACQALPDPDRAIYVKTTCDRAGENIAIEVRDEGTGIPEEVLPRIMDPFFTTRRGYGGTGLGLSVSQNIVKDHGGSIQVENKRGKGAAFTVLLPVSQRKDKVKVLVADDDLRVRELIINALAEYGVYNVHEAANGAEACVKLGQDCPDLLVTDIVMPDMDGVEVCRVIRKDPTLSKVKVIVVTGFAGSSKVKEVRDMGFTNVLPKPFRVAELMESVGSALAGMAGPLSP